MHETNDYKQADIFFNHVVLEELNRFIVIYFLLFELTGSSLGTRNKF